MQKLRLQNRPSTLLGFSFNNTWSWILCMRELQAKRFWLNFIKSLSHLGFSLEHIFRVFVSVPLLVFLMFSLEYVLPLSSHHAFLLWSVFCLKATERINVNSKQVSFMKKCILLHYFTTFWNYFLQFKALPRMPVPRWAILFFSCREQFLVPAWDQSSLEMAEIIFWLHRKKGTSGTIMKTTLWVRIRDQVMMWAFVLSVSCRCF